MKSYHMTTADVSVTLNISPASVRNLNTTGRLPNKTFGGINYYSPTDVDKVSNENYFIPATIKTVCPTGVGLNGHRDPETNKLMGQTIRPGYWTAFGSAIWLQCKREEDENTPFGTLRYRMRDKALPVLRILAEADEEPTPLNKFKKKGFFRSLFSV